MTKTIEGLLGDLAEENAIASAQINHYKREIEKLKQDKLKLTRALEFYANLNSWESHDKEEFYFPYYAAVKNDQEFYKHLDSYFGGNKARKALQDVFGSRIFFFDPFKEEDILR